MDSVNHSNRLIAVAFTCWLGLAITAAAVQSGLLVRFDTAGLLLWRTRSGLNPIGPPGLGDFVSAATHLGDGAVRLAIVGCVGAMLAVRRKWRRAALLAAAVLPAGAINTALKSLFARPRPDFLPHLAPAEGFAFPSGHTFSAATTYLALALALGGLAASRWVDRALLVAAFALAALVAFSRVWLGVHYPSDVIAGMFGGFGWVLTVRYFLDRLGPDFIRGPARLR